MSGKQAYEITRNTCFVGIGLAGVGFLMAVVAFVGVLVAGS